MKSKIISSTLVILGFVLGATALSAVAAWTAPASTPPNCTSGQPGCDAPINVSASSQSKLGLLTLQSNLTDAFGLAVANGIKLVDSSVTAGTAAGKVLTSDANGVGTWQSPGTISTGMVTYSSSNTWFVPTGARYAKVTVVGGGVQTGGSGGNSAAITCQAYGGVAQKFVSLSGISSVPITFSSDVSVTVGSSVISASRAVALGCVNGSGSGGDILGVG